MPETLSLPHEEGEIDLAGFRPLSPFAEEDEPPFFDLWHPPSYAAGDPKIRALVCFANDFIRHYAHASPTSVWYIDCEEFPSDAFSAPTVPDLLAAIRARFPMSTSDLARIFRVERPTIYSWMRGEAELREANRRRLLKIADFADRWAGISSRPLEGIKSLRVDGSKSFFDLLTEDPLREERIHVALERIARDADRHVEPIGSETPGSLADAARVHGMEPVSEEERGWNLRFLRDRDR